jgi:hypothetical protein
MTQIFIVSGTSWTVPGDWSNSNSIETIGGGGGGGTANSVGSGTGGGGGGYSKITNLSGLSGSITLSRWGRYRMGQHARLWRRRRWRLRKRLE